MDEVEEVDDERPRGEVSIVAVPLAGKKLTKASPPPARRARARAARPSTA